MGYHTVTPTAKEVYATLRLHPNFKMPDCPKNPTPEAAAKFVLEAVSRFVSPPKVDGENDELACIDVATAIATHLGPELIEKLKRAAGPELPTQPYCTQCNGLLMPIVRHQGPVRLRKSMCSECMEED
jgi:hypothetical protein